MRRIKLFFLACFALIGNAFFNQGNLTAQRIQVAQSPLDNPITFVWTGAIDNNWENRGNWNVDSVPSTGRENIVIPVTQNQPKIYHYLNGGYCIRVGNIQIDSAATLDLYGDYYGSPDTSDNSIGGCVTFYQNVTGKGKLIGSPNSTIILDSIGTKNINFVSGKNHLYSIVSWGQPGSVGNINSDIILHGQIQMLGVTATPHMLLNFNNHHFTLKSYWWHTASIWETNTPIQGATNVTIERYIPANAKRAWRLLSVPTFGTQTIKQSWQENQAAMQNNQPGYGTLITSRFATAASYGFDSRTTGSAFQKFNQTAQAWEDVNTNLSTLNATTREGYFLFIRGDRAQLPSTATISNTRLRTTGSIYQGDLPEFNLPAGKFAVVGNVYPCEVEFRNIELVGDVSRTFYVWDSKKYIGNSLGAYQTISETNDYNPLPGGGSYAGASGITGADIIWNMGQAVLMRASGINAAVLFKESAKYNANSITPYNPVTNKGKLQFNLVNPLVSADSASIVDATVAVFQDNYTSEVDKNDAIKFTSDLPSISLVRNNQQLVVEACARPAIRDSFFLQMQNLSNANYQLKIAIKNPNYFDGYVAILHDTKLQTATAIDLGNGMNIDFTADSQVENRFYITLEKLNGALPIRFMSFNASRANNNNLLNWKMNEQQSVHHFDIERSLNGNEFSTVYTMNNRSSWTPDFKWADDFQFSNYCYYRIKAVDFSGQSRFSTIAKLVQKPKGQPVSVFPNPIEGNMVNVHFANVATGMSRLTVLDVKGTMVYSTSIMQPGGSYQYSFNLPNSIAAGQYQLEITAPGAVKYVQAFIKTN